MTPNSNYYLVDNAYICSELFTHMLQIKLSKPASTEYVRDYYGERYGQDVLFVDWTTNTVSVLVYPIWFTEEDLKFFKEIGEEEAEKLQYGDGSGDW